jgi:heme exporter protein CcmD
LTGVIEGGFEYVVAAYAITALVLVGYAGSVYLRWRRARKPPLS